MTKRRAGPLFLLGFIILFVIAWPLRDNLLTVPILLLADVAILGAGVFLLITGRV